MGAHVSVPMYRRSVAQRLRLEGRRCARCGVVGYPPTARCNACGWREGSRVLLSGEGRLHAWTWIGPEGAPPEFVEQATRSGGYHVGLVDLAEGPRVTGQLVEVTGEPEIGMPVRAVLRRLYREEHVQRYGVKFVPLISG